MGFDWDVLQWPAMVLTLAAAWLVGSTRKARRTVGFWVFLASNALWIAWAGTTTRWPWWCCRWDWPR